MKSGQIVGFLALVLSLIATPICVEAQSYPQKPVRFIVPTGPGGSVDIMARLLAQKVSELWGQPIVVENRPGGGGMIGVGAVAKSRPDGYTLLVASNGNLVTTDALFQSIPYDPVKDLAPIVLAASTPYVLVVHPSFPAKIMRDLVRLAKEKPKSINAASAGNGGTAHLAIELLNSLAGIQLLHVPYKTSQAALTSVVSGETSLMFTGISSGLPLISSNRIRLLAAAGDRRLAVFPDVPTIAEGGVAGYEVSNWTGILAPAGVPQQVISSVHDHVLRVLQMPDIVEGFRRQGLEVVGSTPEHFGAFIQSEIAKWGKLVRDSSAIVN